MIFLTSTDGFAGVFCFVVDVVVEGEGLVVVVVFPGCVVVVDGEGLVVVVDGDGLVVVVTDPDGVVVVTGLSGGVVPVVVVPGLTLSLRSVEVVVWIRAEVTSAPPQESNMVVHRSRIRAKISFCFIDSLPFMSKNRRMLALLKN